MASLIRYDSEALHGGLTQEVRAARLRAFDRAELRVLVATNVAARGLDVVGLESIVNYDLPRSTSDYTHRVGRTGRAGRAGVAISFVASTGAGNGEHFALIERRHAMRVPREVLPGFEPKEVDPLRVTASEVQLRDAVSDAGQWLTETEGLAGAVVAAPLDISVPGVRHSKLGLAHDRMHGGVKGRRLSKKDKLRAQHAEAVRRLDPTGSREP
jgi:superfamily II DNA/RNA helicase